MVEQELSRGRVSPATSTAVASGHDHSISSSSLRPPSATSEGQAQPQPEPAESSSDSEDSQDDVPLLLQVKNLQSNGTPKRSQDAQRRTIQQSSSDEDDADMGDDEPFLQGREQEQKQDDSGDSDFEDDEPLMAVAKRKKKARLDEKRKPMEKKNKVSGKKRRIKNESEGEAERQRSSKKMKKESSDAIGRFTLYPVSGYVTNENIEPLDFSQMTGKWWDQDPLPEGQKWHTLAHNGVCFPPPYKPHGVQMRYDGRPLTLTPEQEEVATFFAVLKNTDYIKNETFCKNFFSDWRKILGKNHIIKDLKKCDFDPIYEWNLKHKEETKEARKCPEYKKKAKEDKQRMNDIYGFAIVDGCRERVGNYMVEPPALFRGRGDHPKTGTLKKRLYPEDVVLNIGRGEKIPKCPVEGHRWKGIIHNNSVTWLAFWKENVQDGIKYVFLHPSSRFKGQGDMDKFEKARMLHNYIDTIRTDYNRQMRSKATLEKQRATALWIIDHLALRVGNEKNEDEADTVGCCSLRVEHLEFQDPNIVQFDFLGKDSMRYYNDVPVNELVFANLKSFCARKDPTEQVFDQLSTTDLNAHLKSLMPGLTAKVFRTYNASYTLEKELDNPTPDVDSTELKVPTESDSVHIKVEFYNRANREVAILCNHQKSVSKTFDQQMERIDEKIEKAQQRIYDLEDHLAVLQGKQPKVRKNKPKKQQDKDAPPPKKISSSDPDRVKAMLKKAALALDKLTSQKRLKSDNKSVALSTSKLNYMDPRITVAWCKRLSVPIEKVFNKSLLDKFPWSMEAPMTWKHKPSKNIKVKEDDGTN